ncbi:hypothetical protein KAS42_00915 [bacterium]|nr:hypothetical protein [bacterium]
MGKIRIHLQSDLEGWVYIPEQSGIMLKDYTAIIGGRVFARKPPNRAPIQTAEPLMTLG